MIPKDQLRRHPGSRTFTDLACVVKDEASGSGLAAIGCNSDDREAEQTRYPELLEEYRVQRILIMPVAAAGGRLARLPRRGTLLPRVAGSLPGEAAR